MAAQSINTEGFVLSKRDATDAFQAYTLFSPEHGSLHVLQRVPKKAATTATPLDLFDEVALLLESSNQGRSWFVKEARLLTRHSGIGRGYETLRLASALTTLIARNSVHEESRAAVADLLRGALAAFTTATRPDIVYLKSVYRFARDEGYPLKQQWFPTLPAADREVIATLLNQPLAGQTATTAVVARLQRRLDDYLRGHTEILLD